MNQPTTSGSAALLATLLATLVGLLRVCWPLRDALADCEAIFRAQEANRRMRDKGGSRLSCAVLHSRLRGATATQVDTDRRAPDTGAQRHRPQGH